jgi:uncharacterized protein
MTTLDARPIAAPSGRDRLVKAVVVGVVAGFLSGLFGVGGGILMVPALVLVMHLDQRLAHGTSLAAVVPIALSSTVTYAIAGEVDWTVALLLAAGAVAGAVVGTSILQRLPHVVLGVAFAALLLATSARMLLDHSDAAGRGGLSIAGGIALVAIGLVTGVLSGLLGVGGGIVMVPVMVVAFGMGAASAKGTSLAVIIPTALMGTWRNVKKHNAELPIAVTAGLAGVVSAAVGGSISVGMSEALSSRLFAGLLTIVAVQMLWRLYRDHAEGRDHGEPGADGMPPEQALGL